MTRRFLFVPLIYNAVVRADRTGWYPRHRLLVFTLALFFSVVFWKGGYAWLAAPLAHARGAAASMPLKEPASDLMGTRATLAATLAATLVPTLVMDNCAQPEAITGTGLFNFDNSMATTGSQAQGFAGCNVEGTTGIERDLWYLWTATCTGGVTISTCGLTEVDTKMAVYNTAECPSSASSLVGCDDDFCDTESSVTFQAVTGRRYLIQLGNYPGAAGGRGQFRVTCDGAPRVACCLPNSTCENLSAGDCRERGGVPQDANVTCSMNTSNVENVEKAPRQPYENLVPREWQPKHTNFNLDGNGNYVDDAIERLDLNAQIDVLVACNRQPTKGDLRRFSALGEIGYVARYIPVVQIKRISVAASIRLGRDERVAHVELNREVFPTTDVSVPAIKVAGSSVYNPLTVDVAFPGMDGSGVNIAVIDTGVDDGVHASLPASIFVGGFDATTGGGIYTNPNDELSHGTHVAGIALGRQMGALRGVATGAGLVDVQVFRTGFSTTAAVIIQAVDVCITNKVAWNIGVINMSLGACFNSNGGDAMSQSVNAAVNAGMVAAVSMGNAGGSCGSAGNMIVPSPAAADEAITVQASSYQGNVDRANDTVATGFYLTGPRLSDGDLDTKDEQKPDVTAPGTNFNGGAGVQSAAFNTVNGYVRKQGTSMAAPHVAGLAAILRQSKPSLSPAAVKQLILNTAEDRGTSSGWEKDWGRGLIDAYVAMQAIKQAPLADLNFPINCKSAGALAWTSPYVFPSNPIIVEGVPNQVNVTVCNDGPNVAGAFQIQVKLHDFSGSVYGIPLCTIDVPGLAAGGCTTVSCPWIPQVSATTGQAHACLLAEIVYGQDSNADNNCAQQNLQIQATMSPARFRFEVVNTTDEDLDVELLHDFVSCGSESWTLQLPVTKFFLRAGAPPRMVEAFLDPRAEQQGARKCSVYILGTNKPPLTGNPPPIPKRVSLGGVTLIAQLPNITDCNRNGLHDPLDIEFGRSKDVDRNGIPDECSPPRSLISGVVSNCITPTKKVPGVVLTTNEPTARRVTTNNTGAFSLERVTSNGFSLTPTKSGDVNGITSLDAAVTARIAAGTIQFPPCQQLAADVNGNGSVTSLDAAQIARIAAGLIIVPATQVGTWKLPLGKRDIPPGETAVPDQNFDAVLVGDVNGSWTPPSLPGSFSLQRAAAPQVQLPISLPMLTAANGASLTIPLNVGGTLTAQDDIIAYDLIVTFDPTVLKLQATPVDATGTLSSGLTVTPNAGTAGQLTVSAFGVNAIVGTGTLLNLKFEVIGAPGSLSVLKIQKMLLNDDAQTNLTDGKVTIPPGCPTVTSIVPTSGVIGSVVTITGTNFTGVTSVKFFNNVTATITNNTGTQVTVTVPAGAVTGPITVSKTGCADVQTPVFTVPLLCPTVSGISSTSGAVGSSVTITGTNLSNVTSVKFANNVTATITGNTATSVTVTVPAGAVNGSLTISKTGCADVQTAPFTVTGGCNGVTITVNPATLVGAMVNQAYSVNFTATGGTGPYQFTLAAGGLPNGVTLPTNGALTVTPTAAGTFNFTVKATDANNCMGTRAYSLTVSGVSAGPLASVSAANYKTPLTPEMIVAGFGLNLASGTAVASTATLPTTLLGTTASVIDSLGTVRPVSLFFVSPGQVNYLMPAGMPDGNATVTITSGSGAISSGTVTINRVSPGIFTFNATGQGVPAALALRVTANGAQSYESIAQFQSNSYVSTPIDLGPESDQVFLVLFLTGARFNSGLSGVAADIGSVNAPVLYAGAQGSLFGLDQMNIRLPRTLIGRGLVDLTATVDGKVTNKVQINIK